METTAFTTMLPDESLTVPVTVARSPWPYAMAANSTDVINTPLQNSTIDVNIRRLPQVMSHELTGVYYITILGASILRRQLKPTMTGELLRRDTKEGGCAIRWRQ